MSEAPEASPETPEAEIRRRSRRSFLGLGLLGLSGLGGWAWLLGRPAADGVPGPLRRVLDLNGRLSQAYLSQTRLAPEFARSRARAPRVNGRIGLAPVLDEATWRLRVLPYGGGPAQEFALADLLALPRTSMITEFKCIEGWAVVVQWAGVRLADFLARYPFATRSGQPVADAARPPADLAPYASLVTPDGQYYVGLDIKTALHPQTLLAYEMNGQPLSAAHGAPLRLITPLKYNTKSLKRLGTLSFADTRPRDYWAELGYDWDAGH